MRGKEFLLTSAHVLALMPLLMCSGRQNEPVQESAPPLADAAGTDAAAASAAVPEKPETAAPTAGGVQEIEAPVSKDKNLTPESCKVVSFSAMKPVATLTNKSYLTGSLAFDLAWNGDRYGLVYLEENEAGLVAHARDMFFVVFDSSGNAIGEPVDVPGFGEGILNPAVLATPWGGFLVISEWNNGKSKTDHLTAHELGMDGELKGEVLRVSDNVDPRVDAEIRAFEDTIGIFWNQCKTKTCKDSKSKASYAEVTAGTMKKKNPPKTGIPPLEGKDWLADLQGVAGWPVTGPLSADDAGVKVRWAGDRFGLVWKNVVEGEAPSEFLFFTAQCE
jgi:hypothetical protein